MSTAPVETCNKTHHTNKYYYDTHAFKMCKIKHLIHCQLEIYFLEMKSIIWVSSAFKTLKFEQQILYHQNLLCPIWFYPLLARLSNDFIFSRCSIYWVKKKRHSPQPALVEKNASPLCILSPPGTIICESRHYNIYSPIKIYSFCDEHRESECPQKPTGVLRIFVACELPDSPGSEFLFPIRPTKMSCISPKNKNDNIKFSVFMMILKNLKKEKSHHY